MRAKALLPLKYEVNMEIVKIINKFTTWIIHGWKH